MTTPAPTQPAPVVVTLVVDQLAAWIASERWPHLPNGGFARLRREGTWVKELTYLHATTETAPGHASLYTGRTPRETRIVANHVLRTDLKRSGSLLEDDQARRVGPDGISDDGTAPSLRYLSGTTLADELMARDPNAVVVGLSLKDRGAAFACGRTPTACIWYDETRGTLTSSTAFIRGKEPRLPDFAQQRARVVEPGAVVEWGHFDREFVLAHAHTPDDAPGEVAGFGRTFPHRSNQQSAALAFRLTPAADALLVDLALASLALRDAAHPMLLGVSFSTNDYVGHTFGPDSHEAWNALAALDAELARLFAGLDAQLGVNGYSVLLAADHGMVSFPEATASRRAPCAAAKPDAFERPCVTGKRLKAEPLRLQLESAARAALGVETPLVEALVDSRLILTQAARSLPAPQRKLLDQALRRQLALTPSVVSVIDTNAFGQTCPDASDESIAALVCRSTAPSGQGGYDIPGDYYLVLRPGHFFWAEDVGGTHGAPYRYDRTVPLLVRYPDRVGGQELASAPFGAFYASAWYALTGEYLTLPYGTVVGR